MPGFQISYDYGKTWVDSPLIIDKPLFPEPRKKWGAVNIFAGNIAGKAKVKVSSGITARGAVDGIINDRKDAAWASNCGRNKKFGEFSDVSGEWIKLTWDEKHTIDRVLLFDIPRSTEEIQRGLLLFSDGSFIHVDQPLPPMAYEGLEISFPPKTVDWVQFIILEHGWRTRHPGLAEFAVFEKE